MKRKQMVQKIPRKVRVTMTIRKTGSITLVAMTVAEPPTLTAILIKVNLTENLILLSP